MRLASIIAVLSQLAANSDPWRLAEELPDMTGKGHTTPSMLPTERK